MAEQLPTLQELRQQIDSLDRQIMELVSQRARCAQQVAEVKLQSGDVSTFYRPEREAQVLRRIMEQNPGPLPAEEMARLFREIMSACLALEKPVSVAFAGQVGSFAHAAVLKHFGRSVAGTPHAGVNDVIREVEAGLAQFGLLPVETSREGTLGPTLDIFFRSRLRVCGEVQLRTHHHLLTQDLDSLSEVKRVYGLPWVFSACRLWLDEYLPDAEYLPVNSYEEGVQKLQSSGAALIGGQPCADQFDLQILTPNIEDYPDQTARYLVVGYQETPASGRDKTALLVTLKNEAGGLYEMLEPFYRHQVSLARIDSRPSPLGEGRCHFFMDLYGHESQPQMAEALKDLESIAVDVRLLGSYPEAVL